VPFCFLNEGVATHFYSAKKEANRQMEYIFHTIVQNYASRSIFGAFSREFQVFFDVVGNGGELHCLIGLQLDILSSLSWLIP